MMRKIYVTFVFSISICIVFAIFPSVLANEEPDILWSKTFGADDGDVGESVQQTNDGGFIIVGYTESYGNGQSDVWLIKTDSSGNEQWTKTFGGTLSEKAYSVQQTNDGGYIITGHKYFYGGTGSWQVFLIKTDSNGDKIWDKIIGGDSLDESYCVKQTKDGGYVITGSTYSYYSFGGGKEDIWLIKTDSNGDEEWNQTYGKSEQDICYSVLQTDDEGYILLGNIYERDGTGHNIYLIKTDDKGDKIWEKRFDRLAVDYGYSFSKTDDGGYIIIGLSSSYVENGQDVWLIKTYSNGTEQWNKTYGETDYEKNDYGWTVQQTSDGGYIIGGYTMSYGAERDAWIIKTDINGNEEWNKTIGDTEWDICKSIKETSDGDYILTGTFGSYGSGDIYLIKIGVKEPSKTSNGMPGFEIIIVILALTVIAFCKRKRI